MVQGAFGKPSFEARVKSATTPPHRSERSVFFGQRAGANQHNINLVEADESSARDVKMCVVENGSSNIGAVIL